MCNFPCRCGVAGNLQERAVEGLQRGETAPLGDGADGKAGGFEERLSRKRTGLEQVVLHGHVQGDVEGIVQGAPADSALVGYIVQVQIILKVPGY